jgi:hypothetical protein
VRSAAALLVVLLAAAPARASGLDALYDRIATDLRAGNPLRVEAYVALCDNQVIACGNARLGDGDSLASNLYWATTGGLRGWFDRRGSGWKLVEIRAADGDILETRVYRRTATPSGALARRGLRTPFIVEVVAHAWRGRRIDGALDSFVAAVAKPGPRHVVAYIGHNGWMDRQELRWPSVAADAPVVGVVAVACVTRSYLSYPPNAPLLPADGSRVPLLLTQHLLFAGSGALDGVTRALAAGETFAGLRRSAAESYAQSENKPVDRVITLFTNPSDPRWSRRP